jgi:hypothetical protein
MMASTSVLPVELLSFTAIADIEAVKLNWSVGIEDNLSHYEIERSFYGRDFENIGTILARGFSAYTFQDIDIYKNGQYYYRLKAVDLDGSYEYSTIVNIEFQTSNIEYRIFPNPVSDYLVIENLEIGEIVQIFNVNGQMVKEFIIQSNSYQWDIDNLPSGTYFMKIGNDIKRLIITK